jgi:hypothetical protein
LLRRKPDGTTVAATDLNGDERTVDGFSSKHVLQTGAFNVNSVSKVAWTAVLRGVRFLSTNNFTYLNLSTSTGTTPVSSGDTTTNNRRSGAHQLARSRLRPFRAIGARDLRGRQRLRAGQSRR